MTEILETAEQWLDEGRQVALATVIETWGAAPVPVGGQLVIDAEGGFAGSVSGGCVEAEVIARAPEVLASGQPQRLEFGVSDETAIGLGLPCGGSIQVYLEKLA